MGERDPVTIKDRALNAIGVAASIPTLHTRDDKLAGDG
jgi:hypothetical protein